MEALRDSLFFAIRGLCLICICFFFFFSSRRRHTRCSRDWSSDVCSSDLGETGRVVQEALCAAYASAGLGRKITLPFRPKGIAKPIDLWKTPERAQLAV